MNIGNILIILSLIASAAAIVFFIKGKTGDAMNKSLSRKFYYITSILIAVSFVLLTAAFLNHEYKYLYVYSNSSSDLAWYYQLSAVWAGQAGSFLLWLFILNILGLVLLLKDTDNEYILMSIITATQMFILFILVIDSPFRYIWEAHPDHFKPGQAPFDGSGLNPLLIDPWMISHPPVLFLGFASATIPFGYAIAALLKREYSTWIDKGYKWVIFSMTSLGIGIFLGAYWAYKVLGWGGYWGWDPVENSSLIPWIIGVALAHGILIQKRKKSLARTNIALAVMYFALVFYSTFLTRSGVLGNFSVHSFGDSPLGKYLAAFIVLALFTGIYLLIKRFREIKPEPLSDNLWHWQSLMTYGLITLILYTAIILVGTSMPILTGIFAEKASAVTVKYYNNISVPFSILILLTMVLGTMAIMSKSFKNTTNLTAALVSVAAAVLLNIFYTNSITAYILTGVSIFVVIQSSLDINKVRSKSILPSRLSHIGMAILVIGVITSNFHSTDAKEKIFKDIEAKVGPVNITLKDFVQARFSSLKFSLREGKNTEEFSTAYYVSPKTDSLYREPHIESGFLSDIYITAENYEASTDSLNTIILAKGEEKTAGSLKIKFLQFNSDHMKKEPHAGAMSIFADLLINGVKVSPGIKVEQGGSHKKLDATIPGTERKVSLLRMNASARAIEIHVTPEKGKGAPILPDSVLIHVSEKRLIWLVWLGLILITIGGCVGYVRSRKS